MVAELTKHLNWDLQEALEYCGKNFSGQLFIRSSHGYEWCFHFFMGRIVGESSGVHTARRWQRLFSQNQDLAHRISEHKIEFPEFLKDSSAILERMVKRNQITREQALQTSRASILESMFDILQLQWLCSQSGSQRLSFNLVPSSDQRKGILPWIFFRTPEVYHEALSQFFTWQQNSLGRFSPNLAPVLKGLVPVNASAFEKNLLALLNGERTVRDLSINLDREPLEIMQTLLPFIDRGIVLLKALPDSISHRGHLGVVAEPVDSSPKPVVAYVDDNPMESRIMGDILREMGCEFVSITEPIKALPELLKRKPALIFLDLVMPIVNGYEVCAQIRRVAQFAETPIIILTANDGIIDRVRAKVVGSTEFLTKPIDQEKIYQTLIKYNLIKASRTEVSHLQVQPSY
jgi:chemotaxis family two-component system response regulator PixG